MDGWIVCLFDRFSLFLFRLVALYPIGSALDVACECENVRMGWMGGGWVVGSG